MNYLYMGVSDLYLPATAAALHLQRLDATIPLQRQALWKVPYFRASCKQDAGKLYYAGKDNAGDGVYVTCVPAYPEVFARGVQSLLSVYHLSINEAKVIPCVPENLQVGFLCSLLTRMGLASTADKLGIRLVCNRFPDLLSFANHNQEKSFVH